MTNDHAEYVEAARWLNSPEELNQWLSSTPSEPLAVDTEFERVTTFFPIPGLVQLGIGECYYLVDPEVAEASDGFREALADGSRIKLFYAMSEDLELFRQWLNVKPAGVIDLQIGAGLAGAGFSVGYAKLVETLFGVQLDKSATRSDWISRPLSAAQEQYALDDVRFLLPLYNWVRAGLEQKDLWEALEQESARFASDLYDQDDPGSHYLKLRGGWALNGQQQQVLQRLTEWRELESRDRNRPRNRILPDPVLIALAEAMPDSKSGLNAIKDLPPVVVRRYGDRLLELINPGVDDDAAEHEFQCIRPPLTKSQQQLYKKVKQVFVRVAESQDIPIEILAPRKRLEVLVQNGFSTEDALMQGWRGALLSDVSNEIKAALSI
ncbi:ribonuclease D [Marinobacter zhejiangensis]|uniref:Ribonuclease D n=1 Tax=Marinobacter zhejiangensis TaxID=488535 RepID=A0A1I4RQ44_9GAMM|nr:HRDC domain-containing protein [Marinobacter zhejiangensis]SFM54315.1 ribonuclease D [Marinobacter zhejiangensis]